MATQVFLLETGSLTVDRPLQVWNETPQGETVPVYALCIVAGPLKILVDTGLDMAWFSRSCPGVTVVQTLEQTIEAQLHQLGIRTDEIETVINTHLHVDNCGGNRYFPGARFIISRTEMRHGYVPDPAERLRYEPHFFENPGGRHTLLDLADNDQYDLVPGITVIPTPGHSSGHLSVIVNLGDEPPMIFTGDAAMREEDWLNGTPGGDPLDPAQALASLQKLQRIAAEMNGQLLFPHDSASLRAFKTDLAASAD